MKKITFLLLFIFPTLFFAQSVSLTNDVTWGNNCGNGNTLAVTINGDLNLNGRTLTLRNVNLIVTGNLNGGGRILNGCNNNPSTYCVKGAIQNNPNITVTRNSDCRTPPPCTKTWNGSQSTNWSNGANWSPNGVPTINCDVIINNNVACIVSTTNAEAKSIKISNTGSLKLNNEGIVKVKGKVDVSSTATFVIENASSLIQVDNVENSGSITMKRNTSITKTDYVYWSSPVANFNAYQVSPNSSLIYKWIPTISSNLNGFGNWSNAFNDVMLPGKGYIVRGPNNFSANTPQMFTAIFTGNPNNGEISIPIQRGIYSGPNYPSGNTIGTEDDDNWNLVGNPYPSAINVTNFLQTNSDLDGYVHVWTHNTPISNSTNSPFYGSFVYNYSSNDYIKINGTGPSVSGVKSVIGSAQGFFVKMKRNSNTTTSSVVFKNSMRGNNVANNQFYRTSDLEVATDTITEKHRIWLNLVAPNQIASSTLIGYVNDATNDIDRLYDAETKLKSNFEMYSLIDSSLFNIQGKALPFLNTDQVPLGYTTNVTGSYTFGLAAVDGLFEGNQTIFIQDLELGITHNLKETPYTFTSNSGRFDNRFILKFSNETLGNEDFIKNNEVVVYTNDALHIEANENIKEVYIYDALGRLISQNSAVASTTFIENQILKSNTPLFIQVILENNIKVVKKVIF